MANIKGAAFVAVLTVNGDQTGNFNANGDYSATPTEFYFAPPDGSTLWVHTLKVYIRTDSFILETEYGNIPELTNGIFAFIREGGEDIWTFPDEARIRRNWDWGDSFHSFGAGNSEAVKRTFIASVNLHDETGAVAPVSGTGGRRFGIELNDDFTGLVHQQFVIFGQLA